MPPLRPEKQLPPGALTPAPRRQDHTPLPYAFVALVKRNIGVHRIPPNVRDDGRRPSEQDEMAKDMPLICPSDKAKYFLFWGLTRFRQIGSYLPTGQFVAPRSLHIVIASQRVARMRAR